MGSSVALTDIVVPINEVGTIGDAEVGTSGDAENFARKAPLPVRRQGEEGTPPGQREHQSSSSGCVTRTL